MSPDKSSDCIESLNIFGFPTESLLHLLSIKAARDTGKILGQYDERGPEIPDLLEKLHDEMAEGKDDVSPNCVQYMKYNF